VSFYISTTRGNISFVFSFLFAVLSSSFILLRQTSLSFTLYLQQPKIAKITWTSLKCLMTQSGMMQRHIRDLNYVAGDKFQSFLAKRAQNNREIDPKMSKRACVFQVSVRTRQLQFLVLAYVLRCKWLPQQARWSLLPARDYPLHCIPQENICPKTI